MATRSTISLEFADGTIGQVYCHWDGYLAHNGKILFENYSDPFILRELIDLGSVSSLRPNIGIQHPFSKFEINDKSPDVDALISLYEEAEQKGWCTFYGRDRGEGQSDARYFKDFVDYKLNYQREEYNYILRNMDGVATWFVSSDSSAHALLTEAFAREAQAELEVA
jgi:hypothetical protein